MSEVMNKAKQLTVKSKVCTKCKVTKEAKAFHINRAQKDGLHTYCKKCITNYSLEKRGETKELTKEEESILLKYFPFSHERSRFICRNPSGATAKESKPLTISDISRENGITHAETQRIFYKFTRLRLATLVVKANEEGIIVTNVVYRLDEIREYIFSKYVNESVS